MSGRGKPETVATAVARLKRLCVVQHRRIAEHQVRPVADPLACLTCIHERGVLIGIWRALEALGVEDSWTVRQ